MKHIPIMLLLITFLSCRRNVEQLSESNASIFYRTSLALKDSLTPAEYGKLDLPAALLAEDKPQNRQFFRIPFVLKDPASEFLLIEIDKAGKPRLVRLVSFSNNCLTIKDLAGNTTNISPSHISPSSRAESLENPYQELPVVFCTAKAINPTSAPTYYVPYSKYVPNAGGTGTGPFTTTEIYSYFPLNTTTASSGGSPKPPGGGSYTTQQAIQVETEYVDGESPVSLQKMFTCFSQIPDQGASFTLSICVDLPVNSDPYSMVPGASGAGTGHVFLTMSKKGADGTTITQSFGFYPSEHLNFLHLLDQVPGAIKDNGGREYNASMNVSLSAEDFSRAMQKAIELSTRTYDLQTYNCTNYALDVYNLVSWMPASPAALKFYLPGSLPPQPPVGGGTEVVVNKSPQTLFQQIVQYKRNFSFGEPFLVIDQSHGYIAPISHGECN